MAISNLDGIIAGFQPPQEIFKTAAVATVAGRMYSTWLQSGRPGQALVPSSGIAGAALTAPISGQIPFINPTSGNTYLARFAANSTGSITCYLVDRLWQNSGNVVTSTAVQNINSVQFPPRDLTGGTSGYSIMIGVEVTSNLGAGTPTYTMNYYNQLGVTATTPTTAAQSTGMGIGSFIPLQLSSGDTGVQRVNWFLQSASHTSGSYSLVAYRILARLELPTGSIGNAMDAIQLGMPRLYNNTVPFIIIMSSVAVTPNINGQIIYTQG